MMTRSIHSARFFLCRGLAPLSVAAGLALAGCGDKSASPGASADASGQQELVEKLSAYERRMAGLIETLRGEGGDAGAVEQAARELVERSVPIVDGFAKLHPDCADYIEASKEVIDELETIGPEAIERDYHQDGALPEGSPECYHAKDLLVHPATVVVLVREGGLGENRRSMLHEMQENQRHLEDVRESILGGGARE